MSCGLMLFTPFFGHKIVNTKYLKDEPKYSKWKMTDCAVKKTRLLNSLEPKVAVTLGYASTTCEIWTHLSLVYYNVHNNSRMYSIFQPLVTIKQSGKCLAEIFVQFSGAINEFRQLNLVTINIKK